MKVMLTGASGQVGQELQRLLSNDAKISLSALDRNGLDLRHLGEIESTVATRRPDVIINAAAYTAVDRAEEEANLAQVINGEAPRLLARAAQANNAQIIHISTDYVFSGQQSSPYREEDTPQPLSSYGRSKLAGEIGVQRECDRYIILRTAWVYGALGRGNFVKTMLRLGAEREELRVVYDQIGSPTWSQDIARAIWELLPRLGPEAYGTYHFTSSGVTSWYDFAVAIFEEATLLGMSLNVQRVVPITSAEYPTLAQRPTYSVLGCEKIANILGAKPPQWRRSLRKMLAELS